jgi:hypothetical protein
MKEREYLRYLSELSKSKNPPLFLAARNIAIARNKMVKAIKMELKPIYSWLGL